MGGKGGDVERDDRLVQQLGEMLFERPPVAVSTRGAERDRMATATGRAKRWARVSVTGLTQP